LSGAWDGGDSSIACRDYPSAGLRASWAIAKLDDLSHEVAVDLCITERVSFSPLDDTVRAPVPLADVPPEVFSEAMRDLDLVVSVTTVANDPSGSRTTLASPPWTSTGSGRSAKTIKKNQNVLAPILTAIGAR